MSDSSRPHGPLNLQIAVASALKRTKQERAGALKQSMEGSPAGGHLCKGQLLCKPQLLHVIGLRAPRTPGDPRVERAAVGALGMSG